MVARPPFELNKNDFLTKDLSFYDFKPIQHNGLNIVLYKIHHIKSFEEASGLFVSVSSENGLKNFCCGVTLRGITPTLRLISRMAPGMVWMMGKENIIYNITHIYSGEKDRCSALVTRNNKIKLLKHEIMIMIKLLV